MKTVTRDARILANPLAILMAAFLLWPATGFAESVSAYTVRLTLNENGSVSVQEEIVYNFGNEERHGIFRYIPLIDRAPGDRTGERIDISSIMVSDGKGNLIPTQYAGGGNMVELKIGDRDATISGTQLYVIRYTAWGAIRARDGGEAELVWNATGAEWPVVIERARVEAVFEESVEGSVRGVCSVGVGNATRSCLRELVATSTAPSMPELRYEHDLILPHEEMVVRMTFPAKESMLAHDDEAPVSGSLFQGPAKMLGVSEEAAALLVTLIVAFAALGWRIWENRG